MRTALRAARSSSSALTVLPEGGGGVSADSKTEPTGKSGGDSTPAATTEEGESKPADTPAAGGIGKLFGRK